MDADLEKMIGPLRLHASRLDAISAPAPAARVFFEVMSGALVWSDEVVKGVPTKVVWSLRPLFAFRSSFIVCQPQEKLRFYWDACVSLFPHWVGFVPARSKPSPQLLEILRKGKEDLACDLKNLEE